MLCPVFAPFHFPLMTCGEGAYSALWFALFGDLGFYEADLKLPAKSIGDVAISLKNSLGRAATTETGRARNAFGAEWQTTHTVWNRRTSLLDGLPKFLVADRDQRRALGFAEVV